MVFNLPNLGFYKQPKLVSPNAGGAIEPYAINLSAAL